MSKDASVGAGVVISIVTVLLGIDGFTAKWLAGNIEGNAAKIETLRAQVAGISERVESEINTGEIHVQHFTEKVSENTESIERLTRAFYAAMPPAFAGEHRPPK